jgi:hypothetical protein
VGGDPPRPDGRLTAATGEVDGGRVARAIVPGRVATRRLPNAPGFEQQQSSRAEGPARVAGQRPRRQPPAPDVDDSGAVIERPLLELRVAASHRFGMSSAAGDRAVACLVNELIARAAARRDGSDDALRRVFPRGAVTIRRAGHTRIDSENVRQAIYRALELPLTAATTST